MNDSECQKNYEDKFSILSVLNDCEREIEKKRYCYKFLSNDTLNKCCIVENLDGNTITCEQIISNMPLTSNNFQKNKNKYFVGEKQSQYEKEVKQVEILKVKNTDDFFTNLNTEIHSMIKVMDDSNNNEFNFIKNQELCKLVRTVHWTIHSILQSYKMYFLACIKNTNNILILDLKNIIIKDYKQDAKDVNKIENNLNINLVKWIDLIFLKSKDKILEYFLK